MQAARLTPAYERRADAYALATLAPLNTDTPCTKGHSMYTKTLVTFSAISLFVGGCARVDIRPAKDGQFDNPDVPGLRCYMPVPYLMVTVTKTVDAEKKETVNYSAQIISLPDVEHPLIADIKPGWGSVEGSLTIDDKGILTTVGANIDSQIDEAITAVAGLATALKANRTDGKPAEPTIILYRIKSSGGKISIGDPIKFPPA